MSSDSRSSSAKSPGGKSSVAADGRSPLPSSNVRTFVNLLLFMHLFCLAVVLLWQTNSSAVSVQLHNVPAGYLKPLHLDVAFDDGHPGTTIAGTATLDPRYRERSRRAMLQFTHGDPLDDELFLEFTYGEGDEKTTIILPPTGVWPPLRRERFQRLAWEIARVAYDENAQQVLPRVLATALFKKLDISQAELRVVRRRSQTVGEANAIDESVRDPLDQRYRETVIAFDIRAVGNAVNLRVIEQAQAPGDTPGTSSTAPAVEEGVDEGSESTVDTQPRSAPRIGPVRQGGTP